MIFLVSLYLQVNDIVPEYEAAFVFFPCSYENPKITFLKSVFQIMQLAINRKIKIQRPLSTAVHKAHHSILEWPYSKENAVYKLKSEEVRDKMEGHIYMSYIP